MPRFGGCWHSFLTIFLGALICWPNYGSPDPGLDLVVLLDQSGSMSGESFPIANDPFNRRIEAVKILATRLIFDATGTTTKHRFSVVEFSEFATPVLDRLIFQESPMDGIHWQDMARQRVQAVIKPKAGPYTNIPDAFETAARILSDLEVESNRHPVILLITDGRPTARDMTPTALRRRMTEQVMALQKKGVDIWVLALNDAGDPLYWLGHEEFYWNDLIGSEHARLAESTFPAIHELLMDFVDAWLGLTTHPAPSNPFDCPPYQKKLCFTVVLALPGATPNLFGPDGGVIPPVSGGVQGETFFRYEIGDPVPGTYRFQINNPANYYIRAETYPPDLVLDHPMGSVDLGKNAIDMVLLGNRGLPMAWLPEWPLSATLTVADPERNRTIPLQAIGQGRLSGELEVLCEGTHLLTLRGSAKNAQGREVEVFSGGTRSRFLVEATGKAAYFLKLLDPDPAGTTAFPWRETMQVRVQPIGRHGESVTHFPAWVEDVSSWVKVEIIDARGMSLAGPYPMVWSEAGFFESQIPVILDWFTGEGWLEPHFLRLKFAIETRDLGGGQYLRSLFLEPPFDDARVRGDPFTVGPIPLRLPWFALISGGLVILGSLGFLGGRFLRRVVTSWTVRREDQRRGRRLFLQTYDREKDPGGLAPQSVEVTGRNRINLDGKFRHTLVTETRVLERLRVKRRAISNRPYAEVSYRWNGEKQTRHLRLKTGLVVCWEGLGSEDFVVVLQEK